MGQLPPHLQWFLGDSMSCDMVPLAGVMNRGHCGGWEGLKCFAVSIGGLKQPQKTVLWVLTIGDFRCNCSFVYKVVVASGIGKSGLN